MPDIDRMKELSAYAIGMGAGSALPQLCRRLAKQQILTGEDIEVLRHAAVLGFDMLRERTTLSPDETQKLEDVRKHLDSLWQSAALAAEGQG